MKTQWWKNAVGYQIYPRSFHDSNGDGIGDLRGIIEKLDYIHRLGVDCLWICPFYRSPMDDNGYDVSDFYDIDPTFGTLADAKELIEKAHALKIRVILDLVLNHTSDQHPWFIESRKSIDNPKRDYYIWQKPRFDQQGNRIPPTNWASFFEGSCWKYDDMTDEYYMKIFSDKMPDLNWENQNLRNEMTAMTQWWLDFGVDGFRVDAIAHLAKDMTFTDSLQEANSFGVVPDWSKFSNRKELFGYLHELHDNVLNKYDCLTVGEVGGGANVAEAVNYAGYHARAFNMVFNFDHIWHNGAQGDPMKKESELATNVFTLKHTFDRWIQGMDKKGWIPHYWLNHDHPRVISQYGDPQRFHRESGSMLGTILLTLPGTPFIYNGEEIGMTNVDYDDIGLFNDVWAKNIYAELISRLPKSQVLAYLRRTSRDNARTPMQWDQSPNAGFTTGNPVQRVVGNYTRINVKNQETDPKSILNAYRHLIRLRKHGHLHNVLVHGNFELMDAENKDIFAYRRSDANTTIWVIANFRGVTIDFILPDQPKCVHYDNYGSTEVKQAIKLKPFQALILER